MNGYGFHLLFDLTPAGCVDHSAGLPAGLPPLRFVSGDFDLDFDLDLAVAPVAVR